LFCLILSWIALAIFLPYFRIQKITYYGLKIIKKEEIENFIKESYLNNWNIIPRSNYFILSTKGLATELNKKYSLNQIIVRKKFPHQLEVDLEEKISSIIYDNGQKYFLLDGEGNVLKFLREVDISSRVSLATSTIFATSSSTLSVSTNSTSTIIHKPDFSRMKNEFGDYPIIFDKRLLPIEEKQTNIMSSKIIQATIDWQNLLEKEGIAIVRYFSFENPLAGIIAYTDKNWSVYWQADTDLLSQLKSLKTVLKNEKPKEYIDVRFGERVYWK